MSRPYSFIYIYNIFNINIKLRIFNSCYNILIIIINYYRLKSFNIKIELIEYFFNQIIFLIIKI